MNLRDVKFSTRLNLVGVFVVILVLFLTASNIYSIRTVYGLLELEATVKTVSKHMGDVTSKFNESLLVEANQGEFDKHQQNYQEEVTQVNKTIAEVQKDFQAYDMDDAALNQFKSDFDELKRIYKDSLGRHDRSNVAASVLSINKIVAHKDQILLENLDQIVEQVERTMQRSIRSGIIQVISSGVLGILFIFFLIVLISRQLGKGINILMESSNQIAEGDLRTKIADLGRNEIGILAKSFLVWLKN